MRKSSLSKNSILIDHICKPVKPLDEKRFSFVDKNPESDWRDLPNIRVKLSDGSYTDKL